MSNPNEASKANPNAKNNDEGLATFILTISCPDTVGIIASVSQFLSLQDCFISESSQFGDPISQLFFMRCVFKITEQTQQDIEAIKLEFKILATKYKMQWRIHAASHRPKVIIMVSKLSHCLNDLLYRYRNDSLKMQIVKVISNHDDLRELVEWHKIPFEYIKEVNAPIFEKAILEATPELVILARYMQILPKSICQALHGKCINIHHSFLPSFKGAKPYHQAYARGVKLIGATAHYVTEDLDEGPIIDQEVERVDHSYGPEKLTRVGQDIEALALARAVQYHLEHRILMNENKTIVFR